MFSGTKKVKKESQGDESDDESEVTRPKRRPQDCKLCLSLCYSMIKLVIYFMSLQVHVI